MLMMKNIIPQQGLGFLHWDLRQVSAFGRF